MGTKNNPGDFDCYAEADPAEQMREYRKNLKRVSLDDLLLAAQGHRMTPQQMWDQRVSFVFGQLMDTNITREQVEARAIAVYGPRPTE